MSTNGTTTPNNPLETMTSEGAARVEKMVGELEKFEAEQHKRAGEMIEEAARLMKASLEHSAKMSEEWRKLALQANKQTLEMLTSNKWLG